MGHLAGVEAVDYAAYGLLPRGLILSLLELRFRKRPFVDG
jgi:hypothetical protein